jgi:hypothetical protein
MSKKLSREEWIELMNDSNALDKYLKDKREEKDNREQMDPEDLERWYETLDLIDESDLDDDLDRW